MLTKLICNGQDLQGQVTLEAAQVEEAPGIVAEPPYIKFSLPQEVLNRLPSAAQTGEIKTINDIPPANWNGDFLILGSLCTSIIDNKQSDSRFADIELGSNALAIFDGCYACNTCTELAQLQENIQGCSIWLNGLKDCNLYYQPAASRLWQEMQDKKISQAPSCKLIPKTSDRKAEFGNAIKLLYQYKSAVAMWNYLVRTRASKTEIIQAPQDYSGFIIQSKRSQDMCGRSDAALTPTLNIKVTLQSGQTMQYLTQGGFGMGIYANKVTQNTYIQYGRDTGTASLVYDNIDFQVTASENTIQFYGSFTFNLDRNAPTFMSASLKVLPVIYKTGGASTETFRLLLDSDSQPDLRTWVALRPYANTIDQSLQTEKNVWKIQVQWNTGLPGDQTALHEDFYYYTAYNKYPQDSDSQSGSDDI